MDWIFPHVRRLRRLLRGRGWSREDTDDLMQDLHLRLLSSGISGEDIRDPKAFLARIALNLSTNAYARNHRNLYVKQPVEELTFADRSHGPEELVTADQSLQRLQRTLDGLDEKTRNAYILHRLYGLTYEQIAEQLDMTVRTVENHMVRAMSALSAEKERL